MKLFTFGTYLFHYNLQIDYIKKKKLYYDLTINLFLSIINIFIKKSRKLTQ